MKVSAIESLEEIAKDNLKKFNRFYQRWADGELDDFPKINRIHVLADFGYDREYRLMNGRGSLRDIIDFTMEKFENILLKDRKMITELAKWCKLNK